MLPNTIPVTFLYQPVSVPTLARARKYMYEVNHGATTAHCTVNDRLLDWDLLGTVKNSRHGTEKTLATSTVGTLAVLHTRLFHLSNFLWDTRRTDDDVNVLQVMEEFPSGKNQNSVTLISWHRVIILYLLWRKAEKKTATARKSRRLVILV